VISVVYSPGARDYHSPAESPLPRNLFIVVAVLGLATYVFSFGPLTEGPEPLGWDIRFAASAALCAMLGLLAKQNPLALAIAVLATMGFLDALSNVLAGTDRGWPLTVIVVLNALQSAAAVGALLLAPKAAKQSDTAGYDAYVDYYNQAVRSYYHQQSQPSRPEQLQRAGYGQAYGDARASARTQRTQRPSQQGDYADLDYSDSRPTQPLRDAATAQGPPGLPSFGQAGARADQPLSEAGESAQPSSSA
jgi:hypothetical protein